MEPTLDRRDVLKIAGSITLVNTAVVSTTAAQQEALAAVDSGGQIETGRFEVFVDDVEVPGWRTVTIPASRTEAGEYREDEDADREKTVWGQTIFDDLEMERGFDPDATELVDWREQIRAGKADEGRKEIAVVLTDEEGETLIQWTFEDAWLRAYDPPELDASADGDVATESIIVAFDGMTTEWGEDPGGPDETPRGPEHYADDGEVSTEGLRSAISDWRDGEIDTDLLRAVIEEWRTGSG